jgi:integrase
VLTDPELREFWRATEDEAEEFHAILRLCLLTGSRVGKVKDLRWDDVNFTTRAWTIRTEKGEKSNARRLVLPSFTLRIIESRPRLASSPYVFIRRIGSHGYLKKNFDRHCLIQTRWSVHDLRRTARTLLSRCGVQSEIAERVLGHTVGGIQSVYDHHPFDVERAHALRQLAQLVETIVTGPHDNVVPFCGAVS